MIKSTEAVKGMQQMHSVTRDELFSKEMYFIYKLSIGTKILIWQLIFCQNFHCINHTYKNIQWQNLSAIYW